MANLPPRSLDDEISYRFERLRFELKQEYEDQHQKEIDALKNAYSAARTRFQWWTTGFGAMAIGLVAIWAERGIEATVSGRVEAAQDALSQKVDDQLEEVLTLQDENFETISAAFQVGIDGRFAELGTFFEKLFNDRFSEERDISTLLPLVVGEAIDIEGDRIQNQDSVALIMEALEQVGPQIDDLEGFALALALRRVERILDTFDEIGDYHNVHRVYLALEEDLEAEMLNHEGIVMTLSMALVQEILERDQVPDNRQMLVNKLLAGTYDPLGFAIESVGMLRALEAAVSQGFDSEQYASIVLSEQNREHAAFAGVNIYQLCFLHDRWKPDGQRSNSDAHDRVVRFAATIGIKLADDECDNA